MEDRATLEYHLNIWQIGFIMDICTKDQVMNVMKKMAKIVDKQNK